jgi:hypothetical protein
MNRLGFSSNCCTERGTDTSEVKPTGGFCFHCGTSIDGNIEDHFAEQHQPVTPKPKTGIKSAEHRLTDMGKAIAEIRHESDIAVQIRRLDQEVIQEAYLVRASFTQSRRRAAQVKGPTNGRN